MFKAQTLGFMQVSIRTLLRVTISQTSSSSALFSPCRQNGCTKCVYPYCLRNERLICLVETGCSSRNFPLVLKWSKQHFFHFLTINQQLIHFFCLGNLSLCPRIQQISSKASCTSSNSQNNALGYRLLSLLSLFITLLLINHFRSRPTIVSLLKPLLSSFTYPVPGMILKTAIAL